MDPAKQARALYLSRKINEIDVVIRSIELLIDPTMMQRIRKIMLQRKKAKIMKKLRVLMAENSSF